MNATPLDRRSAAPWLLGAVLVTLALVTPRPAAAQSEYWTHLGALDASLLERARAMPSLQTRGVGMVGLGVVPDEAAAPVVIAPGSFYTPAVLRVSLAHGGTELRAKRARWRRRLDEALASCRAHVRANGSCACLVMASVSWGAVAALPAAEQRGDARFLVDHGADVVLGEGAGGVQRVERLSTRRGEALVAYGIGTGVGEGERVYLSFALGLVPSGSGHRVRVSTVRATALGVEGASVVRLADLPDGRERDARLGALRGRLGAEVVAVE
jgi:hypothetical protein